VIGPYLNGGRDSPSEISATIICREPALLSDAFRGQESLTELHRYACLNCFAQASSQMVANAASFIVVVTITAAPSFDLGTVIEPSD
jgi:hypothetical protein